MIEENQASCECLNTLFTILYGKGGLYLYFPKKKYRKAKRLARKNKIIKKLKGVD